MRSPTALSTRSDSTKLPAVQPPLGGQEPVFTFARVLLGEASADAWRLVELVSLDGRPFDARLSWTAGDGSGATATISVGVAARVCVYARSVKVDAANRSTAGTNRVLVTIADGFDPTRNQLEVDGQPTGGGSAVVAVPAFARAVRLEVADPAAAGASFLAVFDGNHTLRSKVAANAQPDEGLSIGAAASVEVTTTAVWRLVFQLHL